MHDSVKYDFLKGQCIEEISENDRNIRTGSELARGNLWAGDTEDIMQILAASVVWEAMHGMGDEVTVTKTVT